MCLRHQGHGRLGVGNRPQCADDGTRAYGEQRGRKTQLLVREITGDTPQFACGQYDGGPWAQIVLQYAGKRQLPTQEQRGSQWVVGAQFAVAGEMDY